MAAGSWKYKAGLGLIGTVVIIWVASAEVTQLIFSTYRHPFLLTWLGASLLSIYLPMAYIKDYCRSLASTAAVARTPRSKPVDSPLAPRNLPVSPRNAKDVEMQRVPLGSPRLEDGDDTAGLLSRTLSQNEKVHASPPPTLAELFKISFILAPLWLLTEYLSNASLSLTSVASTTILSSTSGLFTLLFGVSLGEDTLSTAKVIAVLVSIAGVVMTELGRTTAADEKNVTMGGKLPGEATGDHGLPGHSIIGDMLGLASAASYGFYTILLRKYAGEEDGKEGGPDMQKVFGCIGVVTMIGLWWVAIPLIFLGWEPAFRLPSSVGLDEDILANGLVGSVISDYFWALSVVWTTPLVATLGLSLTIPLAMLADMVLHGQTYSFVYILGSAQVFGGFLVANLADRCTGRHKQEL